MFGSPSRRARHAWLATVLAGSAVAATACPLPSPPTPGIPASFVRISPNDGGSYSFPIISGDGDVVVYRRAADVGRPFDEVTPLIVTRVGAASTVRFDDIGQVQAISHDGRWVVHRAQRHCCSYDPSAFPPPRLLDTTTGDEIELRNDGNGSSASFEVSDDGTVSWVEYHDLWFPGPPSTLHLVMWHAGRPASDVLLPHLGPRHPSTLDPAVNLSADGTSVLTHDIETGSFARYDTTTGAESSAGFTLPIPPSTVDRVVWASPDLTTITMNLDSSSWIFRTGQPAEPVDPRTTGVHAVSENGEWGFTFDDVVNGPTPPMGGPPIKRTLRKVDLSTLGSTSIATSVDNGGFYFSYTHHIADTGRVAIGWTNSAYGDQPTAPWAIYVVG